MKRPFVFATGGTGGHIFPALAIAEGIRSPVVFAGHKIEENEYLKEGIHEAISIPSAQPTSIRGWLTIARGVFASLRLLKKVHPYAVVGFGSYHSFPLLVAARLLRIPIILFEPNASFGKVNALFAHNANLILSQFPLHPRAQCVEMPIRKFVKHDRKEAKEHYGFDPNREVVLVMGGSQGAKIFEELEFSTNMQVLHLGGKHSDCESLRRKYSLNGIDAKVLEFEDAMHWAWSAADYAVCRSGAMTVAEQLAYQVPTLFIPFPLASGGHQLENARYVSEKRKSGIVLEQTELNRFEKAFEELRSIDREKILPANGNPLAASCIERYYFIGAGGIGMSSLIHILRDLEIAVSGSDVRVTPIIEAMIKKGASLFSPQREENVPPFAIVVYSTAINGANPEKRIARKKQLPLLHRSELLASLTMKKIPLLVAGTHGKTSTSALLAYTLKENGTHPMYSVGGILKNYQKNGEWGKGAYAVVEADESDGSFLNLPCHSAILTNIEPDHLDFYRDEKRMLSAYRAFISQVKHHLVWCADDKKLSEISPHGVSYGFSEEADVRILKYTEEDHFSRVTVQWEEEGEFTFTLPQLGEHAILNATGVLVLLKLLGFVPEKVSQPWRNFEGVGRRLELIGTVKQVEIYDDYAHHPTEVLATLRALRKKVKDRRIVSIFQPHRFSRFRQFANEFVGALEPSDAVFVTDIYAAGERPIENVSPKSLLMQLKNAEYVARADLSQAVTSQLRQGDVLITLGAGDVTHVGKEILALLNHE